MSNLNRFKSNNNSYGNNNNNNNNSYSNNKHDSRQPLKHSFKNKDEKDKPMIFSYKNDDFPDLHTNLNKPLTTNENLSEDKNYASIVNTSTIMNKTHDFDLKVPPGWVQYTNHKSSKIIVRHFYIVFVK